MSSELRSSVAFASLLCLSLAGCAHRPIPGESNPGSSSATRVAARSDTLALPPGATRVPIDYLDGIVLLPVTLSGMGGHDTTGTLVLDTGAGALALDASLAQRLGVTDSDSLAGAVNIAPRALSAMRIGARQIGPVAPLLTVDMRPVWSAVDRQPFGLLGQSPLAHGALVLDVDARTLTLVPPADSSAFGADPVAASRAWLGALVGARARPLPFRMGGDEKILLTARLSAPRGHASAGADSLTLILDTGATKCVLFEEALASQLPALDAWPAMRGLSAPTLFGSAEARVVLLPEIALVSDSVSVARPQVDALVIGGALPEALQRAVGEPVHGLLGDSFLRHFRMTIDYEDHVLWLEPRTPSPNPRPYEYSQPGIQLERSGTEVVVSGVVTGSPAARAGVAQGDRVLAIDRLMAAEASVLDLARALEGPPGSRVRLRLRRGDRERTLALPRRWLLPTERS